jgi:hypothetical protein
MRLTSIILFVTCICTAALIAEKANPQQSVRLAVPAAEATLDADPNRFNVLGASLRSDGKYLIIDTELKDKATTRAGVVLRVYVDTDNNAATGAAEQSGEHKGFEYKTAVELCIDDFKGGATCSGRESKPKGYHGLAEVSRFKKDTSSADLDDVRQFYDAEQTPLDGKVVEGKISYADLGVKSGQTVRLVACTASPFHDFTFFPDVILQLK